VKKTVKLFVYPEKTCTFVAGIIKKDGEIDDKYKLVALAM
jgi:hypothetical protein